MSAALQELRRLSRRGFDAQRLFTQDGSPGCLLYQRQRGTGREVLLVADQASAIAYRTDLRLDPDAPFDLPATFSLWHQAGDLVRVCHALFTSRANESG